MHNPAINNISPIDGRYQHATQPLQKYFSEAALIKYRVFVEIKYFIALYKHGLPELAGLSDGDIESIDNIYHNFSDNDAQRIKEIERTTNHDIKAVEYFLKEKFDDLALGKFREFIHFGLTSQDINNTAIPLSLKEGILEVMVPALDKLLAQLRELSKLWLEIPMLAHTHGQPASPTTVGKEIYVFHYRLERQINQLLALPFPAKFGGATGNFNAHKVAYPDINWNEFADFFVNKTLKLQRSEVTTQIEHYDFLASIFDGLKRICTIIIDLNRDAWSYISMNYFKQKIKEGEVGSSAMPHKVNPIDFENSEGNAGIAIALFEHLASKLPISRLQRDLTDSTVLRNIGLPLAHMLITINSTLRGLDKLIINQDAINRDLENNWIVIAEAIQTALRKVNYPQPYEKLKELTRTHDQIGKETIHQFIRSLDIDHELKEQLLRISPFNYIGILPEID
ncbi:MAG: adenylosuccinate lyase [Bacteroidetes bacterium]|nr:MAG: adenylosuccinate lyase [Bacteroidota bacterium]